MIELPKELGNLKDLKRRASKAIDTNASWEDMLSDAYEYFLPNRNLFDREDVGQKKSNKIFDGTAEIAIQQGASKLQEYIAPIWKRWATAEPSVAIQKLLDSGQYDVSEDDIRENLEDTMKIIFDYINRSNFSTQFYEAAVDILIGTGTLKIDEVDDDDMPIVFNTTPQKGVAFEEGPHGDIKTHWRPFTVKARHIEEKWQGFKVSSELAQKIKDNPDSEIKLTEGVVFEPKSKVYYGVVWVDSENSISWAENFGDSSPWITARYTKVAGEVRGRGPALQVLSDVKSLNKVKEFVLKKGAIDVAGIFTATDDGVTNPYTIRIAPNIIIPVGSNNSSNPSIARLDTSTNLNLVQFEIVELQNNIKMALFGDLRDPDSPVISATQYAIEARELVKRIGSAFGRLQTELLIPILKRVSWILARRGLIQPLNLGGKEISIKFTSPLARAQDAEDMLSVQQAIEFVINTAGPDFVKIAYKVEDLGTWAGKKSGMPSELIRDEAEKKAVIESGARAVQAQQQQGQPQEPIQ
jgi:hypothetical protein